MVSLSIILLLLCNINLLFNCINGDTATNCELSQDGTCHEPIACETDQWISQNGTVPGYHVLCITKNNNALDIEFYRQGVNDPSYSGRYTSDAKTYKSLRIELERILKIQLTDARNDEFTNQLDKRNPWSTHEPKGIRIRNIELMMGTILIFEGGIFIYPAIHVGFERDIIIKKNDNPDDLYQYKLFKLITLSVHPPVFQVLNFIQNSDCDHIIGLSEPYMKVSGVSHMHNTAGNANKWRTSTTHWLRNKDDIISRIQQHCAQLLKIPRENQELIQVLRYLPTQQYDSHWDYFDPSLYKGTEMENKIRGGRNRVATLFWYMSDVDVGGWTYFPRSGKLRNPTSYKLKKVNDCDGGLKVQPRKGAVILFYNLFPDGNIDPLSLHGACPVGEDNIKWGANIWYWTKKHYS